MIYIVKIKVSVIEKKEMINTFETIWPVDADCNDEAIFSIKKYYKQLSKKENKKYNIEEFIYINPTLE